MWNRHRKNSNSSNIIIEWNTENALSNSYSKCVIEPEKCVYVQQQQQHDDVTKRVLCMLYAPPATRHQNIRSLHRNIIDTIERFCIISTWCVMCEYFVCVPPLIHKYPYKQHIENEMTQANDQRIMRKWEILVSFDTKKKKTWMNERDDNGGGGGDYVMGD